MMGRRLGQVRGGCCPAGWTEMVSFLPLDVEPVVLGWRQAPAPQASGTQLEGGPGVATSCTFSGMASCSAPLFPAFITCSQSPLVTHPLCHIITSSLNSLSLLPAADLSALHVPTMDSFAQVTVLGIILALPLHPLHFHPQSPIRN